MKHLKTNVLQLIIEREIEIEKEMELKVFELDRRSASTPIDGALGAI